MPSPYMEAVTSNNRKPYSAAKVIKERDKLDKISENLSNNESYSVVDKQSNL